MDAAASLGQMSAAPTSAAPSMYTSHQVPPTNVNSTSAHGTNVGSNATSRYEALLRQLVTLNGDLQKTAALSQTLQHERDGLKANNDKLKDQVKRLHERCEKLQMTLMQQTEHKIEADKKHEELIAKWKKQLEAKVRAFEALQRKFAPPRDLEQLRLQIQEELEGPHLQRIEALREEIEKHRQVAFTTRREYEILKTEYEQFSIDQSNEIEMMHQNYEHQIQQLRKKLQSAEEMMHEQSKADVIRRMEQQLGALSVENKALQEEVHDVREEMKRRCDLLNREKSEVKEQLTQERSKAATLELDQRGLSRQIVKVKDECESFRMKWMGSEAKVTEVVSENEKLKDLLKQKETLVMNSHNSITTRLKEERSSWERERTSFREEIRDLTQRLQVAEREAERAAILESHRREVDGTNIPNDSHILKQKDQEIERYRNQIAEMENKFNALEEEKTQLRDGFEKEIHRLKSEIESLRKNVQSIDFEKEHLSSKLELAQEVASKLKTESLSLRSKLKEMEAEYKGLQGKHREVIQRQEDIELEKEQAVTKLKYLEQDCQLLNDKLEKDKESHAIESRDMVRKCKELETDYRQQKAAIKSEMRKALAKVIKELSKTQKKRDAYKKKCLQIHEQHKRIVQELSDLEEQTSQMKHDHSLELQKLMSQLADVENERTRLVQSRGLSSTLTSSSITTTNP